MQIYELNDDSSLHQLKNYAGTNARAATSSAVEVRVGQASVEKNDSSISVETYCAYVANVSHISIKQYEWQEIRGQIHNINTQ